MRTVKLKSGVGVALNDAGVVMTILPCGATVTATREPTPENLAEARAEGYGDDVLRCLVEHELLHSIIAPHYFLDGLSPTMKFLAGVDASVPYYLRLWEESQVIALQTWRRKGSGAITSFGFVMGNPHKPTFAWGWELDVAIGALLEERDAAT